MSGVTQRTRPAVVPAASRVPELDTTARCRPLIGRRARSSLREQTTRGSPAMHLVMIGGSDAGISAALRAREPDPDAESRWSWRTPTPTSPSAASPTSSRARSPTGATSPTGPSPTSRRRHAAAPGHPARRIDVPGRKLTGHPAGGGEELLPYDELIVGTARAGLAAIDGLVGPTPWGSADGVHLLHSMGDTFAVMSTLEPAPRSRGNRRGRLHRPGDGRRADVRGLLGDSMEQLPEVLPTVDPELGALVHAELTAMVWRCYRDDGPGLSGPARRSTGRLHVQANDGDGSGVPARPTWCWSSSGSGPIPTWPPPPAPTLGQAAPSGSTATCGPASRRLRRRGLRVTHHRCSADLPAARHHRPQTGTRRRRERARRRPAVRRQPRHPGRQDLRPRRRPHRAARP